MALAYYLAFNSRAISRNYRLDEFKSVSDLPVYSSGKFKLLFGDDADAELQKIKVVKLPGSTTSDAEIRSAVLALIDTYFNVENWDFGETFISRIECIHSPRIRGISTSCYCS